MRLSLRSFLCCLFSSSLRIHLLNFSALLACSGINIQSHTFYRQLGCIRFEITVVKENGHFMELPSIIKVVRMKAADATSIFTESIACVIGYNLQNTSKFTNASIFQKL